MGANFVKGAWLGHHREATTGNLVLRYEDIENGGMIAEAEYDLVVLAVGVQPSLEVAELFGDGDGALALDDYVYVDEADEDLDPGRDQPPRRIRRRRGRRRQGHPRFDPPRGRGGRTGRSPPGATERSGESEGARHERPQDRRVRLPVRRQHLRLRRRRQGRRRDQGGRRRRGRPLRDVHLLRRDPAGDRAGCPGAGPRRPRRGLLFSQAAHVDVPRRRQARRHEPLPVHAGERARAVLLDAHRRQDRRHRKGGAPCARRHQPHAPHRTARTDRRRDDAQEPRRGRRHRRPACGAGAGGDRPHRLPGRERGPARRPCGRVRPHVPARPQGL